MCIATSSSQVKQKFSLTSKFLLFKVLFRIHHQGNERMILLWVVVKNWLNNLVSPAHTSNHTLQLCSSWHICLIGFYNIHYHSCSVDQVFTAFSLPSPFFESLIWGYNCTDGELSIFLFYKYWLKQNAVKHHNSLPMSLLYLCWNVSTFLCPEKNVYFHFDYFAHLGINRFWYFLLEDFISFWDYVI